jgi:hypothetical protein
MSYTVSNLYASKIFAEHPIALWTLDEDFAFTNLLSASTQSLSTWTTSGGTSASVVSSTYPNRPILEDGLSYITKSASVSVTTSTFPTYFTESNIDTDKRSISLSTWFFSGTTVDYVDLGIDVSGSVTYKRFENESPSTWTHASYSVDIPTSSTFKPIVRVGYLNFESTGSNFNVYFNGLSFAQWSEVYNRDTSGTKPIFLSENSLSSAIAVNASAYKVSEIQPYGFNNEDTGYYFINRNKMLANNTSLPMVFGSGNITRVNSPIDLGVPSIAIPGKTFLNDSGKYKNLSAEFWIRLYTDSQSPIRVFGPVSNSDGLYVEQEFLTLKVGSYTKSYFVGKWYRPMLIDIRYTSSNVSVLLNGDLVIDMDIDVNNITFASSSHDWLGFYSHSTIYPFELDAVAIYPYIVPEQIARRRFVYAQAVDNPEEIVSDFKGESFFVDFSFAKYTSSMTYPDMNRWSSGFFSNLNGNSRSLSFVDYELPEIKFSYTSASVTIDDNISNNFLIDNYDIQNGEPTFIKMRPNASYDNVLGSIYFNSINTINSPVASIFGVFEAPQSLPTYSNREPIMTFTNSFTSDKFKICLSQSGLSYEFQTSASTYQIANYSASASQDLFVGIELEELIRSNFAIIGNFFNNPQNVSLNLGGYEDKVFTGKIRSLTFNNKMFTIKDTSGLINDNGTMFFTEAEANDEGMYPFTYVGNYTFIPISSYGEVFFDIGSAGYWEDSLPLSYFGTYVQDTNSSPYYDLDLIQFNIDVPGPITMTNSASVADAFSMKSYITLQDFKLVGKKTYSSYTNTENIGASRVLDLVPEFSTLTKKFEVVDGTIIYPPKELIDFENYYITIHLEMRVRGIKSKPVNIKRMSLTSLAFDETSEYRIGTRSGHSIIPFTRSGLNYDYKEKNPFTIYRDSTPYLYLTGDSGIAVLPYQSANLRGLSFPINDHEASSYKLTGLQFWMFYNKDETISSTQKMGTIIATEANAGINDYYDIYLVPELNGKRGSLKVYKNNVLYTGAKFFVNGRIIDEMKIVPLEWTSILISFTDSTDITLNSKSGRFEIYEGFLANNIAFFQQEFVNFFSKLTTGLQWTNIDDNNWDYPTQLATPLTWQQWGEIAITDIVSQTGDSTFKTYLGLSEQVFDDSATAVTNSDGFDALTNVTWVKKDVTAV